MASLAVYVHVRNTPRTNKHSIRKKMDYQHQSPEAPLHEISQIWINRLKTQNRNILSHIQVSTWWLTLQSRWHVLWVSSLKGIKDQFSSHIHLCNSLSQDAMESMWSRKPQKYFHKQWELFVIGEIWKLMKQCALCIKQQGIWGAKDSS